MNLIRFGKKKWRWRDRVLAVALTIYEDSLCGRCGHPRDRAYNPDMEGWYSPVEHTCQACAVLETKQSDDKHAPGRKVGVADDAWESGYAPDDRWLSALDQSDDRKHQSGDSEDGCEQ